MKEFYASSKCTKLVTTIFFMILCTIHKVSNKFVDEFFTFLCHHLLLELNCLTANYYAKRALTQKLGLNYENTHACVEAILFWGDHKDDVSCPKCGNVQYKDIINKMLLMKVFRHFPIILRLQRLFKTPTMFELMLWHSQNNGLDGLMTHPCHLKAWKHIH
jgi:ribosomal protein S27AE